MARGTLTDSGRTIASRVIILNGPGSVGKTTIARELQAMAADSYLHVRMDSFIEMLPESMLDHENGLTFEELVVDGQPAVRIQVGPVADRTFRGMRRAIAALADAGNNLIVDDVAVADEIADYRKLLSSHEVTVVGLQASLEILESRERHRGDRHIGLARWQHERIHPDIDYDLTLDTSGISPSECARRICARLGLSLKAG